MGVRRKVFHESSGVVALDQSEIVLALEACGEGSRASDGEHKEALLSSNECFESGVMDEVSQRCSGVVAADQGDTAGNFEACTSITLRKINQSEGKMYVAGSTGTSLK